MVNETKVEGKINQIFDAFAVGSIFKDKGYLQIKHHPEEILHRDEQLQQVASILAPALRGERTSNLFIYGQTGTGKTISMRYIREQLENKASSIGVPLRIEYLNCKLKKVADTEYRILAELIKKLGGEVPSTGLPTDQVYNKFIELIEGQKQTFLLVLDEIDQAVKKISSDFLYNLTRLNSELEKTTVSIIGISNDLKFLDLIDPRVRSSLSEEEIVFPPYNALQLQDILKKRAENSFRPGVLKDGVIAKCAAFAAREHGDARRALDLLRIAGEVAERAGDKFIDIKHIDLANEKIDRDKIIDIISSAPKQFQIVLMAAMELISKKNDKQQKVFTGDIYSLYQDLCVKSRNEVLTQRRVSDLLGEFDMLGLINARVVSKGRGGRTREIKLLIPEGLIPRAREIIQGNLSF
jgi:archaeal cell division control protein 6